MTTGTMTYQDILWADSRPDGAFRYLLDRGLTEATIWEYKLGYVPRNEKDLWQMRDSIEIPYVAASGEVIGSRYRLLDPAATHKYHSIYGTHIHLYNVVDTWNSTVFVTEGEFDTLILKQLGLASVAVPGVKSWRQEWKHLFRSCDEVRVVMDADEAGAKGSNRVMAHIGDVIQRVRRIELPAGSDVTDLYLKDPDELRRLLR